VHIYNNSVLHHLYNMAVIYSKARAFKAKAKDSYFNDVGCLPGRMRPACCHESF